MKNSITEKRKVQNRPVRKALRDEWFQHWINTGLTPEQAGKIVQQWTQPIPEGLDKGIEMALDNEDKQLLGNHAGRKVSIMAGINTSF
jgi:hypothetical protein